MKPSVSKDLVWCLVGAAVVFVTFVPLLGAGYFWDDYNLLFPPRDDPGGQPGYLAALAGDFVVTTYFRPLVALTYWFDQAVWTVQNPAGFHLTSVLIHLLAMVSLAALLVLAGARLRLAVLVAVAVGVSPRLLEATAWISARSDLLATLFTVCAATVIARSARSGNRAGPLLSALCLLAIFSKESGTVACGAAVIAGLLWRRRDWTVAGAGSITLYLFVRLVAVGWPSVASGQFELQVVLAVLGSMASNLVTPWATAFEYGHIWYPEQTDQVLGLVVLPVLGAGIYQIWKRADSQARLLGVFFLASLLPVSRIIPFGGYVITSDRYLYMPLVFLVALVGYGASRQSDKRQKLLALPVAVLAVAGAVVTSGHAAVWAQPYAAWQQAVVGSHQANTLVYMAAGEAFDRRGEYELASLFLDVAGRAASLNYANRGEVEAPFWNIELKRARSLGRMGRFDQSLRILERLHRDYPQVRPIMYELAVQYGSSRNYRRAGELLAVDQGDPWSMALMQRLQAMRLADSQGFPDALAASVYYSQTGNVALAVEHIRQLSGPADGVYEQARQLAGILPVTAASQLVGRLEDDGALSPPQAKTLGAFTSDRETRKTAIAGILAAKSRAIAALEMNQF